MKKHLPEVGNPTRDVHIWLKVLPPTEGITSHNRSHLWLEISPPIRDGLLQLETFPLIRDWHLPSEVSPSIRGVHLQLEVSLGCRQERWLGHIQGHTGAYTFPNNYVKRVENMWVVNMHKHICTAECTHSNQGMGLVDSRHVTEACTQWCTCFHTTMKWGLNRHRKSCGSVYMSWCMYTF